MHDLWDILSSIATIIGAGVVTYTAILAIRQLKEMTRSRNLEAMLQVYELISSESARTLRRYIYENLISKPEDTTEEEHRIIEEVSVVRDRVGALVRAGLVPEDLLFQSHARMITRIWDKLEPYIAYHRQAHPEHVSYFENLANSARRYQEQN
jgi:hypothetical protein